MAGDWDEEDEAALLFKNPLGVIIRDDGSLCKSNDRFGQFPFSVYRVTSDNFIMRHGPQPWPSPRGAEWSERSEHVDSLCSLEAANIYMRRKR